MGKYSDVIAAVSVARQRYKAQEAAIDAQAKVKKAAARKPVIAEIQKALAAGASQNMVAIQGMGYTGIAPMKAFMANPDATLTVETVDALNADLPDVTIPYRERPDGVNSTVTHLIDDNKGIDNTVQNFGGVIYMGKYNDPAMAQWYYDNHKDEFTFRDEDLDELGVSR